jgi:RecJ-like exonuclease
VTRPRESDADLNPGDQAPPDQPAAGEDVCPDCGGDGTVDGRPCETCGGSGRVIEAVGGG